MELPVNSMRLNIFYDPDDGNISVKLEENLSRTLVEDEEGFLLDLCAGLISKLQTETDSISYHGSLLRQVSMLEDELYGEDGDIEFEADEELVKALKEKQDNNVLIFKKKLH